MMREPLPRKRLGEESILLTRSMDLQMARAATVVTVKTENAAAATAVTAAGNLVVRTER